METEVLLLLVSFLTATLTKLVDVGIKKWKDRSDSSRLYQKYLSSVRVMNKIYAKIQDIGTHTSAIRVLVLASHNGGLRPTADNPPMSSVLYEYCAEGNNAVKPTWQGQPVDAPYVRLLKDVMENGSVELVTHDMKPGILKDVYESSGVERSMVYSLALLYKRDRFVYLSMVFEDESALTAKERNYIRIAITALRELFLEDEAVSMPERILLL